MPVQPIPCGPGGGTGEPGPSCCAPSITSAPLCLADGTPILVVLRSLCACDGAAPGDPETIGWVDPATGAFTAGPLPAGAGPCDATGCVDTLCRQRCDDTDGDGQADATYSELWCIRADGSAELVLTYQDDPSVPYVPVAPVECTYGCPESETVTLCDDSGPFLRRYSFLNGTATYEDVALDGQTPHVVSGTVGVCGGTADPGTECASPTTPAATLGLCLADGTPIAVLITRDCDGTTTQDGWLNLTTGAYSTGAPPAGAQACGDSRAFELAGLVCDVDPGTGDVLGLVLVEYEYNPDGSLASVRLVDPATGTTYTLQGELTMCPGGTASVADQDLTVLCDTLADGTVVEFVRDYRREPASGQISGHTDYGLDGAPYTTAGTVGVCSATSSCDHCQTQILCDTPGDTGTASVPGNTANGPGDVAGTLSNGVGYAITGTTRFNGQQWWGIGAAGTGPQVWTFSQPVTATWAVRIILQNQCVVLPEGSELVELSATHTWDPATRTLCTTIGSDQSTSTFRQSTPVTSLSFAMSGQGNTPTRQVGLMAVTPVPVTFQRTTCRDCTGQVTIVTDSLLDGTTPYTVTGTVGQCTAAGGDDQEPCRNSSTLLVCDLPTDGDPAPTVTDTPGAPYYPYTTGVTTAGAQTLWDGGTLTLPDAAGPQPGTGGTVRTAAAVIQAPRPVCDAGTARVTVQIDVTQLGPDNGCRNSGFLGLYNGPGEAGRVALALAPLDTPAGWSGTLTAEADVPADDLAAGNIVVLVAFDAYDDSGATCPPPRRTAWQLSAFTATTAYDQTGCDTQFLRTVTVDCETGAVTAVTDTTLDGQPYTLTGEPGQCTPTGSGSPVGQPCGDTEIVQLCDLTYDPQAPIPTPASDFTLTGNVVVGNGGTTLWFAQANQPADGVAELLVSGLLPATLYEFRFASAWIGAGGSDPVGNAAIYRLDILDGATVLATRTRNVSNGSNVFPGGVLSEDMPPLAFIAPATGAVTIRFTDQTTGGPINDRDLFLMPLEVRTAALTVTRTPFLRRFTFDCDGGLTSTQDLALDGTTPYVVEGEAGYCTADGAAAGAVTPCDAQNVLEACRCDDTDGDGLPDVGYVELLAVDCQGTLTSLGTYTDGLTAPYTPVSPVDCDAADEEEGAPPAVGVQAHRVELSAGASWDASAIPALQSVTAVAHSGTGTITTADGTSTLHTSEAATWSVARPEDAALTGPLTITADSGTVTITWTQGETL